MVDATPASLDETIIQFLNEVTTMNAAKLTCPEIEMEELTETEDEG